MQDPVASILLRRRRTKPLSENLVLLKLIEYLFAHRRPEIVLRDRLAEPDAFPNSGCKKHEIMCPCSVAIREQTDVSEHSF